MLFGTQMTLPATTGKKLQKLREEVTVLRARIAWLKQMLFGGAKGGKLAGRNCSCTSANGGRIATATRPTEKITYQMPVTQSDDISTPPRSCLQRRLPKKTAQGVGGTSPGEFSRLALVCGGSN